ncbi:MAG TPA: lipoprotein [Nevskiaceae bacterium]|nr:lipoprotein [Nevskiaceae bacterium]
MRFVPALLVVTLLAACGQSGDLYLPGMTPPPSQPPPVDQTRKKDQTPPQPPITQPAPPQPN